MELAPRAAHSGMYEKLKRLFEEIDSDGGGTLGADEIKEIASNVDVTMRSHRELREVLDEMDIDRNGEVDLFDFVGWWEACLAQSPATAGL